MAPPPRVALLPDDLRAELDARLIRGAFSGYAALSAWLDEQGFEIGKSALHQYGQGLKKKLAAIETSTQAAQLIAQAAPDDRDQRSEAVMSLVQTELFNVLVNLQEAADCDDPEGRLLVLGKTAKAIADLSRASVNQKKWSTQVQAKLDALLTEAQHGENTLDIATLQRIRKEVYGLAA